MKIGDNHSLITSNLCIREAAEKSGAFICVSDMVFIWSIWKKNNTDGHTFLALRNIMYKT